MISTRITEIPAVKNRQRSADHTNPTYCSQSRSYGRDCFISLETIIVQCSDKPIQR